MYGVLVRVLLAIQLCTSVCVFANVGCSILPFLKWVGWGITVKAAQPLHLLHAHRPSSPELGLNPAPRLPWQQQLSIH